MPHVLVVFELAAHDGGLVLFELRVGHLVQLGAILVPEGVDPRLDVGRISLRLHDDAEPRERDRLAGAGGHLREESGQ